MTAPFAPPRSRNDPCPCGSGKRYKHCHGSESPPTDGYVAPDPSLGPLEAARTALRAGRHADAVAILESAGVERGADPAALRLLGEALRPLDAARSRACWERVVAGAPDDAEANFFLGDLDREAGDIDGALAHFERALARAPDHPAILNNLGLALEKAGRLAEAEAKFRRMLELVPDALNALANLAQNLHQQRRYKEAVPLFDQLIARMPAAPVEIWANRGVAQRLSMMLAAAEKSLVRATEMAPDESVPWRELGLTRTAQQQWGAAAIAFRKAYELDPSDSVTESMLVHVYAHEAYWKDFARLRARVVAGAASAEAPKQVVPFAFQAMHDDPAAELEVARRWREAEHLPAAPRRPARRTPDGKLRLGFVSADLHAHPVGRLIVGLFERLDRRRFEVYAYATGPEATGDVRQRLVAAADRFRAYPIIDYFEIADTMRSDGIDVAFDLTGFTAGAVLSVLQLRPAPVQVNFLGYTGTLASTAIDWVLTDPYCVPPASARHFVEKPLYLEPCYLPSDTARAFADAPLTRATYKLPDDAVVYASQTGAYKIVPEHYDAMLDVLNGVAGSVLWLRDQPSTVQRRLQLAAEARGVAPERVMFAPNEVVSHYLRRFRLADLFLDTAPFGGHTTVNDALFGGLPVLALAGRSFAARASASQVIAAGLPELVVASRDDYVALAIALGNDRPRLAALAERLRTNRDALPLFDMDRYTRAFEAAIERAWRETPLD
jgi:predicted O-linked N-acetylglucosamine transferase (SPINDLY family)